MKCEVCGKPTEPKMCDWLTNVMCPEHAKQVKDYIEGLKPRRDIHFDPELGSRGEWVFIDFTRDIEYRIDKESADALYEYMRRERGDTEVG